MGGGGGQTLEDSGGLIKMKCQIYRGGWGADPLCPL